MKSLDIHLIQLTAATAEHTKTTLAKVKTLIIDNDATGVTNDGTDAPRDGQALTQNTNSTPIWNSGILVHNINCNDTKQPSKKIST